MTALASAARLLDDARHDLDEANARLDAATRYLRSCPTDDAVARVASAAAYVKAAFWVMDAARTRHAEAKADAEFGETWAAAVAETMPAIRRAA